MKKAALIIAFSLTVCLFAAFAHAAVEKWQGVDETVVGKYSTEHGRPPRPSFIEAEGDLLLFAFLIAGVAGGFAMGYYYRDFMSKKDARGETDAG